MKKFGKVVSLFLALVMAIGILGVIGPIGVSAEGEENVYMWPLYMEAGITGKGSTFACYFGGTAAQGNAMYAKGILEMSINSRRQVVMIMKLLHTISGMRIRKV